MKNTRKLRASKPMFHFLSNENISNQKLDSSSLMLYLTYYYLPSQNLLFLTEVFTLLFTSSTKEEGKIRNTYLDELDSGILCSYSIYLYLCSYLYL